MVKSSFLLRLVRESRVIATRPKTGMDGQASLCSPLVLSAQFPMSVRLLSEEPPSFKGIGNMKSYNKTMPIISSVVSVGTVIMPLPTYLSPLTLEEKKFLNGAFAIGGITRDDIPLIIKRMRRDPQREGTLKRAINKVKSNFSVQEQVLNLHDLTAHTNGQVRYGGIPSL